MIQYALMLDGGWLKARLLRLPTWSRCALGHESLVRPLSSHSGLDLFPCHSSCRNVGAIFNILASVYQTSSRSCYRVYELFLNDSSRVVTRSHREFIANEDRHKEHKAWKYNLEMNRRQREVSVSFNNLKPTHEHPELEKSTA